MGREEKKKQKKMKKKSGGEDEGKPKETITDERFASVASDPRFMQAPKKKSKVVIDSRFRRILTDKRFASSKAPIDKRGKPKDQKAATTALKHYYRLDEEDEENDAEKDQNADGSSQSDSESEKPSNPLEEEEEESDSFDEEPSLSTSTTDDSDDESVEYDEEEEYNFLQPEENIPEIEKETRRLAIVNLDWNNIRAVDLYVLLSSFLPRGGQIVSVAVYPSEFGLKRMAEEAVHGPLLFDGEKKSDDDDDDGDDDDEMDNKKLRAYELSRLRYYYAVVECDSVATADYLYKECDGTEVERTANKLDLRFIPDSMELKHEPRDVATEAPSNYEGLLDFETKALTKSDIPLTWEDEDDLPRKRAFRRMFNSDQLDDVDLRQYLASDNSDMDDEDNADRTEDSSTKKQKKKEKYLSLLQSGNGSDEDEEEDNDDEDMEVTFNSGLEDISKKILEKKDKKSESVWDAYLRKKKEKKKLQKNRRKNSSEDESSGTDEEVEEQADDFFVEEPLKVGSNNKDKKGKSGKKGNSSREAEEASAAELELLLADEKAGDTNLKGYNLKSKKNKRKKGQEIQDEEKIPSIDYTDPRFRPLLNSSLFALDPTDPQYKRSAAYARQVALKHKMGDQENVRGIDQSEISDQASEIPRDEPVKSSEGGSQMKEKHELSLLVKSIKNKSKQIPLPSQGKAVPQKHGHLLHKAKKRKQEK